MVPGPQHLGALHGAEQVLVYVLAFAPVLLLAFTAWRSRRRDGDRHPPQ